MGLLTLLDGGGVIAPPPPAFTPSAICVNGVDGDWIDARTADGMYVDTAQSIPVVATADLVGALIGRRNVVTFLQGTAGTKPSWHEDGYLYATGTIGFKYVDSIGDFAVDYTGVASTYWVFDMPAGQANTAIGYFQFFKLGSNPKLDIASRASGGDDVNGWATKFRLRGASYTASTEKAIPPSRVFAFAVQTGASSAQLYVNNAAGQAIAAGTITGIADYLRLSMNSGKGAKTIGAGVFNKALTADDMANIRNYYAA